MLKARMIKVTIQTVELVWEILKKAIQAIVNVFGGDQMIIIQEKKNVFFQFEQCLNERRYDLCCRQFLLILKQRANLFYQSTIRSHQ